MTREILCKICNIKDIKTAQFCAEAGADFLGLHGIWHIKQENLSAFKEISKKIPNRYPKVSIVLVTRQQEIEKVLEMIGVLRPSFIQLHSPWQADAICALRKKLSYLDTRVGIIGVVALGEEPLQRIETMRSVVDYLLFDSSFHGGTGRALDLALATRAIRLAQRARVLIAGGLTPENVQKYIETLQPSGVDVQTGLEYADKPGVKDPHRIIEFLKKVKGCS